MVWGQEWVSSALSSLDQHREEEEDLAAATATAMVVYAVG